MPDLPTIETNTIAPDFTLQSHTGEMITLSDYAGEKNIVLFFVRTHSCYACRQHVEYLARTYAEFQKNNTEVLVIINADASLAADYASVTGAPFPVLADPDHVIYEAYGLNKIFMLSTRTGSALIDQTGTIRYIKALNNPWAWRNETETLMAKLAELPANDVGIAS